MKKALTLLTSLFAMGTLMAQTPSIVTTDVTKRNVIIEEFTGVGCGYCPDGHARANAICEANEGHAWAINIHEGGYANGSGYTTTFGDQIATLWNITGYPCGTVNRISMTDRGQWAGQANTVLSEDSPVNVAAKASIDPVSRVLTVEVEAYFTDDQTDTANYLNVALLQNNILGPQSNYGNYNPDYIEGNLYRHMHMLRHMLTGTWGEVISTTKGTLVQKTYTYTLPASIGSVAINDFADLQVLCFVTESNYKNILTGNEAEMTILPGAFISGLSVENEDCSMTFTPVVRLSNTYDMDITSWTLTFNGTDTTYEKTVAAGSNDTIHLPSSTISEMPETFANYKQTASVKIAGYVIDGTYTEADASSATVTTTLYDLNIYTTATAVKLGLGIDHYGSETAATLVQQSNCTKVWASPAFTDRPGNNSMPTRWYFFDLNPADAGLYRLTVTDAYGDGMVAQYTSDGNVGVSVVDANGTELVKNNGTFGEKLDIWLNFTNAGEGTYVDIEEANDVNFSIYPNPVHGQLSINASEPVRMVEVIDMTGRTVMTLGANTTKVNAASLANGVYVVRVTTESGIGMQKIVKE